MPPQGLIPPVSTAQQVKGLSCEWCGKKFTKQENLNMHISVKHKEFSCQSCGTEIYGNILTFMAHQRSCTGAEGMEVQFVENGTEGSGTELVGTGTEESSEVEVIGVVSGKKAFEKYFPMGEEEFQEIQHAHLNGHHDSLVGLAHAAPTNDHLDLAHSIPAHDQVGLAQFNGHHNNHVGLVHAFLSNNHIGHAPTNNHVSLAHTSHAFAAPANTHVSLPHAATTNGGHSIHNGVHPMPYEGYPIHNGVYPIHNGGQPMPYHPGFAQRSQFQMVNWHHHYYQQQQLPRVQNQVQNQHSEFVPNNYLGQNCQMAAPISRNGPKKPRASFKGKLKEWLEEVFRYSEGDLTIFSQTLQADMAQQMRITLTQLKTWFRNRNAKKRKTGN